jgi:tRNA dimethylallyltransferase
MQIYKGMDIGTAKATKDEMLGVAHHMIDIVKPDEDYTAAQYQKDALDLIKKANERGAVPVVAGGTGLYIHSLVYEIDFSQTPGSDAIRQKYIQLADDKNKGYLYNELKRKDPAYANLISASDTRRVIRRLEIIESCGECAYNFRDKNTRDNFIMIGLKMPRELLYARINERVNHMIESGLVDEARRLLDRYGQVNALKAIGYKEWAPYFTGSATQHETVELIKRNTRRYAKRQMTWFNRDDRINWFDLSTSLCIEDTINDIIKIIKEKGF